jgi:hypothetical protein
MDSQAIPFKWRGESYTGWKKAILKFPRPKRMIFYIAAWQSTGFCSGEYLLDHATIGKFKHIDKIRQHLDGRRNCAFADDGAHFVFSCLY